MKRECFQYWHTQYLDAQAKDSLPSYLLDQLMPGAWGIQIDTSKTQAIEDIEKRLHIGKTDKFVKRKCVEVDKKEISNFSHFVIRPKRLGWKEHVFFEISSRICPDCLWGVKISSPIQMRDGVLRGIGSLGGIPLLHTKLLFLTPEVRNLFESEGITGLEYQQAEKSDGTPESYFLANVTHHAYVTGSRIIAKHCVHNTIGGAFVFDEQVPAEGLKNDFQMIDRVIVSGIEYSYDYPLLVVTGKALRLLLDHGVKKLDPMPCVMLKERFLPLIVS